MTYERKSLPLLTPINYCDGSNPQHLDVRITNLCDSACSFCIAAEGMKHARKFDLEAMLESAKKVQPASMSIIGGEPFLFMKKLLDFMTTIEAEVTTVEDFYLTTALPITIQRQPELFNEILGRTTTLNVSLNHYLEDENNRILNAKKRFNRIALLEEILKEEGVPGKIRVHLNLSRGGIDTATKLNTALYRLKEMGVREVKVNELMNAPEDYVSFEEMTGIKLLSPYSHGCSSTLDYFPDLAITLKRSCFVVEPSRAASKRDLLKILAKEEAGLLENKGNRASVLYEDGSLAESWEE